MTEREARTSEHHDRSVLDPESDRLPSTPLVRALRWWIPAIVCLIGVVLLVAEGFNSTGLDAFFAFVGAGTSIWLINFLWRLGISGDEERDNEEAARVYLAKHGHWPDEEQLDSRVAVADTLPPDGDTEPRGS